MHLHSYLRQFQLNREKQELDGENHLGAPEGEAGRPNIGGGRL